MQAAASMPAAVAAMARKDETASPINDPRWASKARGARRLGGLADHLALARSPAQSMPAAAPTSIAGLPDARAATGLYHAPRLLSNQQMATFLGTGLISLPVDDVPPMVHQTLHETAERTWTQSNGDNGAGLGNNIWPAVPQLGDVLRSAVVHGGLQSILGDGYVMNAHRHMHNSSTQGDQSFHKDTGNRGAYMHRPRSILIFFVPAGATLEMVRSHPRPAEQQPNDSPLAVARVGVCRARRR